MQFRCLGSRKRLLAHFVLIAVKHTWRRIYHFNHFYMSSSVVFNAFMLWCRDPNCPQNFVIVLDRLRPWETLAPHPYPSPWSPPSSSVCGFDSLGPSCKGWVCPRRASHPSFLSEGDRCPVVWTCYILFIRLPGGWSWGRSHFGRWDSRAVQVLAVPSAALWLVLWSCHEQGPGTRPAQST